MAPYKNAALRLKALAHPVRLQILDMLRADDEVCVCHMEAAFGKRQAYISQQLMVLREAGAAGVDVLIEDQVVDQRWPRGISTNAEPVTGYLPPDYAAAGGYYDAPKLPPVSYTHLALPTIHSV